MSSAKKLSKETKEEKLLRLPQVLELVPISKTCWWEWVRKGKAPAPVRLGPRMVAWKLSSVQELISHLAREGGISRE